MLIPLVLAVGAPVVGALVCLFCGDRASKPVAVASSLACAGGAGALVWRALGGAPVEALRFGPMPWLGAAGARGLFGCELTAVGAVLLAAACGIGLGVVIYSCGYLTEGNLEHPVRSGHARYFFWLLLFIAAMAGLAVAPTLLQALVCWEVTTVCSWALISFRQDETSLKAGLRALAVTSFGGLFFIAGVAWVAASAGGLEFSALGRMAPGARAGAFALFLLAAWAKSAQVPFHTWLPGAMAAPTPVSAYLHAAAMVKAGLFLVARLVTAGWALPAGVGAAVAACAAASMVAALYLYFYQDDLKRLLAYSTVAQLGYVFLGLGIAAAGAPLAARGAVLHILMHACAKGTLFLTVGGVAYACGTRSISRLGGLAARAPVLAVGWFAGALALAGVPPLACFWSKLYVLSGALQLPGAWGPAVVAFVVIESLLTFGWLLWVGQRVFFGAAPAPSGAQVTAPVAAAAATGSPAAPPARGTLQEAAGALDPPRSMEWVILALAALCALAPLLGVPLVRGIGGAP